MHHIQANSLPTTKQYFDKWVEEISEKGIARFFNAGEFIACIGAINDRDDWRDTLIYQIFSQYTKREAFDKYMSGRVWFIDNGIDLQPLAVNALFIMGDRLLKSAELSLEDVSDPAKLSKSTLKLLAMFEALILTITYGVEPPPYNDVILRFDQYVKDLHDFVRGKSDERITIERHFEKPNFVYSDSWLHGNPYISFSFAIPEDEQPYVKYAVGEAVRYLNTSVNSILDQHVNSYGFLRNIGISYEEEKEYRKGDTRERFRCGPFPITTEEQRVKANEIVSKALGEALLSLSQENDVDGRKHSIIRSNLRWFLEKTVGYSLGKYIPEYVKYHSPVKGSSVDGNPAFWANDSLADFMKVLMRLTCLAQNSLEELDEAGIKLYLHHTDLEGTAYEFSLARLEGEAAYLSEEELDRIDMIKEQFHSWKIPKKADNGLLIKFDLEDIKAPIKIQFKKDTVQKLQKEIEDWSMT